MFNLFYEQGSNVVQQPLAKNIENRLRTNNKGGHPSHSETPLSLAQRPLILVCLFNRKENSTFCKNPTQQEPKSQEAHYVCADYVSALLRKRPLVQKQYKVKIVVGLHNVHGELNK